MQLHVFDQTDELNRSLAEWITALIETTLQKQDRFTFVLTGGNSPKAVYDLLASSPFKERIDWQKIHLFWGDERAVPFEDDRNNAKMSYTHLINKVAIPESNVHIMDTRLASAEAADKYESILKTYFPDINATTFDLVLLGMGDDAHTLSLFPGTAVIAEKTKWVTSFYLDAQKMDRITLTAPVVNQAAHVAFLTFGEGKANALKQVLEGEKDVNQYPSQIIQPQSGSLHWFTDKAATKLLRK